MRLAVQGEPAPAALTARQLMAAPLLNQLVNGLLDRPRLASLRVLPQGLLKAGQFELKVTVRE